MYALNNLRPAIGAKKTSKRLGRGMGSGKGKTCGKGHKGQHARAGGYHKLGFEGGQMPLQRRLPKFGFRSAAKRETAEIRLSELRHFDHNEINIVSLRTANLISHKINKVTIIYNETELAKAFVIGANIKVTKGAKEAILRANGRIES